jgi:hypothetical protein
MNQKAWIVSVNMGYGHQRTAYALKDFAIKKQIINANDYKDIPNSDRVVWESSRKFYEFVSKFKKVPILGNIAFSLFDKTQKINEFYPKKDESRHSFNLRGTYSLFAKNWGKHLIKKLSSKDKKPFVSTFFTPAFMAEYFKYQGDIFCVVCDADISRSWAPLNPRKSRIKYFAPNKRVVERLRSYGVKRENIFLTGYPLPIENIGKKKEILKQDVKQRIVNLDPLGNYRKHYKGLIKEKLGDLPDKTDHPLTIIFAVGGAGAQKEIGIEVLRQLRNSIVNKEIKIILVAGTKLHIKQYFEDEIERLKISEFVKDTKLVEIIYGKDFEEYFDLFNKSLRKADILWTKPSELSFYSALGLPIIIAPTIGSQEEFNRAWLLRSGFGIEQEDLSCVRDWLFDLLKDGQLAEIAMEGFIEGEQMGVLKIKEKIKK